MDKKNTKYSSTKVFLIIMGVLVVVAGIAYLFKSNNTVAPVLPNIVSTSTISEATTTVSIPDVSQEATTTATTTSPLLPTTGFDLQ